MSGIDPIVLRSQREKAQMSMAELAERSGVNKTTIARIERGEIRRNRSHTIKQLCKALKLEPDQLAGLTPIEQPEVQSLLERRKSQLNARVSHSCRNALALVAKRYEVGAAQIIEFAPLLFHIVASESLRERDLRISEMRRAREVVESLGSNFPHLSGRFANDWTADEIDSREERSIQGKDILARLLEEGDPLGETYPWDYDDEEQNPFIDFLRRRLTGAQPFSEPTDNVDGWSGRRSPGYAICRAEALEYFGGDEKAADALVEGTFAITEIPKELRESDDETERAAWARARAEQALAEFADLLAGLEI